MLVIITTNSSITIVGIIDIVYCYRIDRMEMTSLSTNRNSDNNNNDKNSNT